ncbi:MAG: MarC family protein [Bacteroidaceae bacterium]|nr:MarC family protein [Bacteroidaceae bacterium]
MLSRLSWQQVASAFIVLFAIIDVLGSTPIFISLKKGGRPTNALKATLISTFLLVGFFYAGDAVLKLFSVDIQSFAVAGSLIIFLLALEMLLDIEIFKYSGPLKEATLIPVVFPLIAGAGSFTTLLSLKAEYASVNIMIALFLNMLFVYIVIRGADCVERIVSRTAIYVLRKFFGVILLAIGVKLFTANLTALIEVLK